MRIGGLGGALAERFEGRESEVSAALKALTKKIVRGRTLAEGVRIEHQRQGALTAHPQGQAQPTAE